MWFETGVRAIPALLEEVRSLHSLSDFLVPSPVARKVNNLSRVHLPRSYRWDLHLLDASEERCLFFWMSKNNI